MQPVRPLVRRLPSLLGLLYFEAAERHGHYTRAAAELGVTQGAVSRQIRQLEEHLGVALFRREGASMVPTAKAKSLARAVRRSLRDVADAVDALIDVTPARHPLLVTAPPSLADRWFVARLPAFRSAFPDLDLILDASIQSRDLLEEHEVDAGLRYGRGHYPGLISALLAEEQIVACARADLWAARPSMDAHPILVAHTDRSPRPTSPDVAFAAATGHAVSTEVVRFNRQALAIVAACEGQGIVVAPRQLVRDAVDRQQLVQVVPDTVPDPLRYSLVWRPDHPRPDRLEHLRGWLVDALAGPS